MPGLRKVELARRLSVAVEEGGARVVASRFSGKSCSLPWRISVAFGAGTKRDYTVYMWAIGHGGNTRSASEYRIQAKLKAGSELEFNGGTTLLLGYFDDAVSIPNSVAADCHPAGREIIVAWDPTFHIHVGRSSSCQVPLSLIEDAWIYGVAGESRRVSSGEEESVLAMRPEYFARYLYLGAGGHTFASADEVGDSRPSVR